MFFSALGLTVLALAAVKFHHFQRSIIQAYPEY